MNDVANQIKSIEAGADDFLSKPIEEKLLIAKVKLLSSLNIEKSKVKELGEAFDKAGRGELDISGKTANGYLEEKGY